MEVEEEEHNQGNEQNIRPNKPIHEIILSTYNIYTKNDDWYIRMLMQVDVYFKIIICEN